jgi:hypothetical protein
MSRPKLEVADVFRRHFSDRTGRPIDERKAFRAELDRGMALADYAVANSPPSSWWECSPAS